MQVNKILRTLALFSAVVSYECFAEPEPKISIKHEFQVSDKTLWRAIGRFCSIEEWQSLVADCMLEEQADGVYRTVVMKDNSVFIERLEFFSHPEMALQYSILSSPIKVAHYQARLQVTSLGPDRSRLYWKAWYEMHQGEKDITPILTELFKNGIAGMESLVMQTH